MPQEPAVRVVRLSLRPPVLTPIRLALSLAGLAAALATGERAVVALLAFVIGAFGAAFLLTSDPRGRRSRARESLPLPDAAEADSWLDVARTDVFPSTVAVAVLSAAALAFDAAVSAVLAGVLAGMAVATLAGWLQIAAWERAAGGRLYAERRGELVFVEPWSENERAEDVARGRPT